MAHKLHSTAQMIKDVRMVIDNGRSHSVCTDLPIDEGTDLGPTALELCLMSFTGCYATIFALTAKKMRITLKDLEVNVEAIKTDEAGTIIEANLDITVKTDAPEDRIQRIHGLTVNCPVGKIFTKAGIETSYNLQIRRE